MTQSLGFDIFNLRISLNVSQHDLGALVGTTATTAALVGAEGQGRD